jgi:SAM-dependent methyltransferase
MLIIVSFFIGVILVIIFLFSSKTLSPIPYFPSNRKDLPLIIKALDLKNNQAIFDLGAGDGIVIFEAAKKAYEKNLNTQFFAVEINPILLLIMHIKRLFHPNKKNIKIVFDDIFKINIKKFLNFDFSFLTFYLYISPWYIDKVIKNISSKIKNFSVVSYFYPLPKRKQKKIFKGKNKIFVYNKL